MNFLQKFLVDQVFKSQAGENVLFKTLFKFIGNNMPAWIGDNIESYISEAYEGNPDVFSIINKIMTGAGNVRFKLYQKTKDGLKEITDHPVLDLHERPNDIQGKNEFIENWLGFKLVTGNTYIYAPRLEAGVNKGRFIEMHVAPSQHMEILCGGWAKPINAYKLNWGTSEDEMQPTDVMHLKYWNPNYNNGSQLYGMSPVKAAIKAVTQSNNGYTAHASSFENMGAAGILANADASKEFSPTQAQNLEKRWRRKNSGAKNFKKIVMTPANLKWINMGISPVDLDILKSQLQTMRVLCNIWGAPSQLLNDSGATTYNNMKEARKALYTDCVIPNMNSYCAEFTRQFLPAWGDGLILKADFSHVPELQEDMKAQADALGSAWWVKPNEKREIMGYAPDDQDPAMEMYWIPSGLSPLDTGMTDEEIKKHLKGISDYK